MNDKLTKEIIDRFSKLKRTKTLSRYVAGSLVLASSDAPLDAEVKEWLSLDSTLMNGVFGDEKLGMPLGRVTEIYGPQSVGKTALLLWLIGRYQRAGAICALADVESSYRKYRAKQLGVDPDLLFHLQLKDRADGKGLEGMEDLFYKMKDFIEVSQATAPETPVAVFWDTIAATPPRKELDGDYSDDSIALQPRVLSSCMRKFCYETLKGSNASLICVNQVRSHIGFVSYDDTPGGKAMKFYSSIRLQVIRTDSGAKSITGKIINKKNKVGPPFRGLSYRLNFDKGFEFAALKK